MEGAAKQRQADSPGRPCEGQERTTVRNGAQNMATG